MSERIQLDPEARITALRGQRDKAVSEHEDTLALLEIYKQAVEQLQARVAELEAAGGNGADEEASDPIVPGEITSPKIKRGGEAPEPA